MLDLTQSFDQIEHEYENTSENAQNNPDTAFEG